MQFAIAGILVVVVGGIALLLRRRASIDPPTQQRWQVPAQLDRKDFPAASGEWIVVVFSSKSCQTCADITRKAVVLASREVSVVEVEYSEQTEVHRRYRIDAVPTVVVADRTGVDVTPAFLDPSAPPTCGPRSPKPVQPGSSPEPTLGQS